MNSHKIKKPYQTIAAQPQKADTGIALIILALAIILYICPNSFAKSSPLIVPVAKINNQIITNLDLKKRFEFILSVSDIKVNSAEESRLLHGQILQKMIDEELQNQEAAKKNITISNSELKEAVTNIAREQGVSLKDFRELLENNNIIYEDYLKNIKSQLLWNKLIKKILLPRISATELEIEEQLESRNINSSEVKLHLAEIYIPFDYKINNKNQIDAKNLTNKLRKEVVSGKNFANIALQFSRSATSEFDGEIGWVGKNDIDSKIYQKIKNLKINEISQPIMHNKGYYLFKIIDKKTVSTLENKDINLIKGYIINIKLQNAAKSYLFDLRRNSFIEII